MAGIQRLLAIVMAFCLTGVSGKGSPNVLGVVALADRASVDSGAASEGTTVYEGDRIATGAGGSLQLRVGGAIVYLAERSAAIVRRGEGEAGEGFVAELETGAAVLSVASGTIGEIVAKSAHIRPNSDVRGVVQVRVIGPYELLVTALRGAALISYHGQSETIAEGKTCRVMLNPPKGGIPEGAGAKSAARPGKAFLIFAIAAGMGTAVGIAVSLRGGGGKGMESPDRP